MRRSRARQAANKFHNTVMLRKQLEEEITKLERQLQQLRASEDAADFSKLLSYQDMISARRNLLSRLPR